MSQQNVNVKGAAKGPENHFKHQGSSCMAESSLVQGSIVGNCEEVVAHLKQQYADDIFTVIVWTRDEIKMLAIESDITITDAQADAALYDISINESHEYGQNEESALSYIVSASGLE